MKTIKEKLKVIRGNRTLEVFGSSLGKFSKSYISQYELGKIKPTTDFYKALAEKENINLNWLIADIGEMYFSGLTYNEIIKENKELKETIKKIDLSIENEISKLTQITKSQLKKF